MKRFLVFEWDGYDPCGGQDSTSGSYDTLQEARENRGCYGYGEILDRLDGVWHGRGVRKPELPKPPELCDHRNVATLTVLDDRILGICVGCQKHMVGHPDPLGDISWSEEEA